MWENIKLVWRDKKARWGLILVIVVLLGTLIPLSFALEANAASVQGYHFRIQFQNGYGGLFYPVNSSDGFDAVTGNYYNFYRFEVHDSDGNNISYVANQRYLTFVFDLSGLNLAYDYDLSVFAGSGRKISFDNFLTTAHTLGGDDLVVSFNATRYRGLVFTPSGVSWSSTESYTNDVCTWSTGLNSHLNNGLLTVSIDVSASSTTSSSLNFGFLISVAGTDFQQLLYLSGAISTSDDYYQLLDDTRDALASGDITPDQASIIVDNASDQMSQIQVDNIVEAHSSFSSIISQFINSSSSLHGQDLLENYKYYNDLLTDLLNQYISTVSDSGEAAAISSLYQVAVQDLESEYSDLASFNFFIDLDSLDNTSSTYFDQEQEILDYVASVNIENLINVHSWINKLSNQEVSEIKSLFENFFSGYFWSVWIEIPIALSVVSALIGSSYFLVARSSRRRRGK